MPMISLDRLRRLQALVRRNRRGTVAVVTAVATPLIVGFAGLGVEVGSWQTSKRTLQTAADAAALSGAIQSALGSDDAGIRLAALRDAARNGFTSQNEFDAVVHSPPRSGAYMADPTAVEVVLARQQRPLVSKVMFGQTVAIGARSVATMRPVGKACVLALDPQAANAVTNTGNASVNMTGCVVASNSESASAINVTGNATLTAQSLWAVGGYSRGGSSTLSLAQPATTGGWALPDPFAGTPIPSPGSCNHNSKRIDKQTTSLNPGTYCLGIAIGAQSDVTFNPGVYIINRGDFAVNGQATIRCNCSGGDGVTIILTSSTNAGQIGRVVINGGAKVTLTAPSYAGAPYRGLLFVQDPRAAATNSAAVNRFNGGAQMALTGALYFPSEEVTFSGTNDTTSCIEVVARTVRFVGNSRLDASGCQSAGAAQIQVTAARIVE
jgi:hypothetical protein